MANEELIEARIEMERLRHTLKPLTALLLVMDYTQDELELAISHIDSRVMNRLDIRFDVARRLLDRQSMRLNNIGRYPTFSPPESQELYTIKTAAIAIDISESSVINAINNGTLNYSDVSATGKRRSIRISQKDIDEFKKHKK